MVGGSRGSNSLETPQPLLPAPARRVTLERACQSRLETSPSDCGRQVGLGEIGRFSPQAGQLVGGWVVGEQWQDSCS